MITEKEIRKHVNRFRALLGLQNWDINITVFYEPPPIAADTEKKASKFQLLASIRVAEGYFFADMDVHAYAICEDQLEKVIAHEMVHIILEPLRTQMNAGTGDKYSQVNLNLIEGATEILARGLLKAQTLKKRKKVRREKRG